MNVGKVWIRLLKHVHFDNKLLVTFVFVDKSLDQIFL